jgi:hypothetical protein
MSIYDFHSKFVSGGERTTLFVALRRLSALDNPQKLFDTVAGPGWPIWDEAGARLVSARA